MSTVNSDNNTVSGEFVDFADERYYVIRNVDKMKPFFISVVSNIDHWLFISSRGGLTAGRVSPATALFPYVTVDKIHDGTPDTGCKTIVRMNTDKGLQLWEPFNVEHEGNYTVSRNLYKNVLGNKICFEEINQDLQLAFRYIWATSDEFGFVRQCEMENLGSDDTKLEIVDGFQNILPAGTPAFAQTNTSNLVDAYKWSELDPGTGLAYLTLYSGITDRAEPCESLRATTVFSLGLEQPRILISSSQLNAFRQGLELSQEDHKRGVRAAYFINQTFELKSNTTQSWKIIADLEKSQSEVVELQHKLADPDSVSEAISASIDAGTRDLARIIASGDGYQAAAEENVTVHHYANVLFNILRGGTFDNQYKVSLSDFSKSIRNFNSAVFQRNQGFLASLPEHLEFADLLSAVRNQNDTQLLRLSYEYLPITFGRRHGDPSRPWNQFAIKIKDEQGNKLLSYEGNWRDIFQNWEALLFTYPGFIENVIAKFVNASTIDGYNPYRITKEGIDWEVEEPDNPWSYIGYWGDHQIIYLQKLLELSHVFHPQRLNVMLRQTIFSYANVPYRIAPFDALVEDPKSTVSFDTELAARIDKRVADMGADGKLLVDKNGEVYQVNLLEKLLVPLLSKLSNLVVDGGIWLNTQRPEWNDANNALVGHGLSMVTLYYLRRYICFLQELLEPETKPFSVSGEVGQWLARIETTLKDLQPLLGTEPVSPSDRFVILEKLGRTASDYRQKIYRQESFSEKTDITVDSLQSLCVNALAAIDHSIDTNRGDDGLFHAYNLIELHQESVEVDTLYPMLEGQVAVLSSGAIAPEEAVSVLEALFNSDIYRPGQKSFMLYPDRQLPGFLERNRIPADQLKAIPLLQKMIDRGDRQIVVRDADGCYRFSANFTNAGDLKTRLTRASEVYGDEITTARSAILSLYEAVFNHKEFTGRSGTMFGFEGLGSIYWHMVSKLLLAVMENFFAAIEQGADDQVVQRLGQLYYLVREGIGFNKTPIEYGAFPTDPYSHTPKHAGARQPGMTGQVKEEVLSRFGELGIRISDGLVTFQPSLLRAREFVEAPRTTGFVDVNNNWQTVSIPLSGLAFTWCQVPIIYTLNKQNKSGITLRLNDGEERHLSQLSLPAEESRELFQRTGRIQKIHVDIDKKQLFDELYSG